jgi:hypothetical protein
MEMEAAQTLLYQMSPLLNIIQKAGLVLKAKIKMKLILMTMIMMTMIMTAVMRTMEITVRTVAAALTTMMMMMMTMMMIRKLKAWK